MTVANTGADSLKNVRVLELFFAIYRAPRGITREKLRTLPRYKDLDNDQFDTLFSRDRQSLEAVGVTCEEHHHPQRGLYYRIAPESFGHTTTHSLSGVQATLIHLAYQAWGTHMDRDASIAIAKVAGLSQSSVDEKERIYLTLDSSADIGILLRAIHDRQPVSFTYTSKNGRSERGVSPWRLIVRGKALYLWGWDYDREEARLFRLSRIEGAIETLGMPYDAEPLPVGEHDPFQSFSVEPLLAVRKGTHLPFRARLCNTDESTVVLPLNWETYRGERAEMGEWGERIIPYACDIVVLAPSELQENLQYSLACAADNGRGTRDA